MPYPYRVFSDLHFGHPSSRLTNLGDLLPLCPKTHTVIFNGDSIEQHLPGLDRGPVEQKWLEFTAGLPALPITLTGNHDPHISPTHHLFLDNGVFIHHGDAIYSNPTPWTSDKRLPFSISLSEWLEKVRQHTRDEVHPPIPPIRHFAAHPRFIPHVLAVWFKRRKNVISFCERYQIKPTAFIFGHVHLTMVRKTPFHIINTGTFQRYFQAIAVDIHQDRLELFRVKFNGGLSLKPIGSAWL